MTRYAANTAVTPERTRTEIERTLTRYGATSFAYGWENDQAIIGFGMRGRRIRFVLPMPTATDRDVTHTEKGQRRSSSAISQAVEQSRRQRWRALSLVVKAKLEAVESKVVTFEEEFGMHFILPTGLTVAQTVLPEVEQAYVTGRVPPLLLTGHED